MNELPYWHKQTLDKPLFEDMLWSRPENRLHAGKLLIIGGNLHGFSAPGEAYQTAVEVGIGTAKVLLPDALQKTVGRILENGEYAPSTPSGSFSKQALASWMDWSQWADAVLLAGDLGRNSETAITIESFVSKYVGSLTVTKDAADYLYTNPAKLFERPQTTIVVSLAQLQKLCKECAWPKSVTFGMTLLQLVEFLHEFTSTWVSTIVVRHNDIVFAAHSGQVSTTQVPESETWRVKTAAHCAVWQLQNPAKPFDAITTAIKTAFDVN